MNGQPHLFDRLRRELRQSLNHYIEAPEVGAQIAACVRQPGLGDRAGPLGALAVAAEALTPA